MESRTFWKGYLKLSLVTCPVAMTPANTESEKVRFHILNRSTGNRVVSQYVDSVTRKPVDEEDEVKGFERGEADYVMIEEDEINAVRLESTRTIDIDVFVAKDSVDWIWYDKAHYLSPNDKVGEEAFAVIREAMAENNVVGISRVVLYRRERAVLLEPHGKGIIVWTLRYGDEVRDAKNYFDSEAKKKSPALHLSLLKQFINQHSRPWDASILKDPVQTNLLEIIAAKKKKAPKAKKPSPADAALEKPSNVISILDALKKSLAK